MTNNEADIYQLVYISTATQKFSISDLETLLSVCLKNNLEFDITGVLLYSHGHFIQLLEGERRYVEKLLEVISQDPRHDNLKVLLTRKYNQRLMQDWQMGFYDAMHEKHNTPISDVIERIHATAAKPNDNLWRLIGQFSDYVKCIGSP